MESGGVRCDRREASGEGKGQCNRPTGRDRKSTRLNSSHLGISYAVFCLKKKKRKEIVRKLDQSKPMAYKDLLRTGTVSSVDRRASGMSQQKHIVIASVLSGLQVVKAKT